MRKNKFVFTVLSFTLGWLLFFAPVSHAEYLWNLQTYVDACGSTSSNSNENIEIQSGDIRSFSVSGSMNGQLDLSIQKQVSILTGTYTGWYYSRATYVLTAGGNVFNGSMYLVHDGASGKTYGTSVGDIHGVILFNGSSFTLLTTSINGAENSGAIVCSFSYASGFTYSSGVFNTQILLGGNWQASGQVNGDVYFGPFTNRIIGNGSVFIPVASPDTGFSIGDITINAPIPLSAVYSYQYFNNANNTIDGYIVVPTGQYVGVGFYRQNLSVPCSVGQPFEGNITIPQFVESVSNIAFAPPAPTSVTVGIFTDTPAIFSAPINITFINGTTTGGTVTAIVDSTPPPTAPNFTFNGHVFEITTTATTSGPIQVCLPYNDTGLSAQAENALQLLHWNAALNGGAGDWEVITSSLNTTTNSICGTTNSLSPFVVGAPDTDNDGMTDVWETANGLNPNSPADAAQDADGDGLLNLAEYQNGTNPTVSDTDGDGMPDNWEVTYGLNPTVNDASADKDGDGVTNLAEFQGGTNPSVNNPPPQPQPVVHQVPVHHGLWMIPSILTGLFFLRRRFRA